MGLDFVEFQTAHKADLDPVASVDGGTVNAYKYAVVDTDPGRILGVALGTEPVHFVLLLKHVQAAAVVLVD